MEEERGRKGSYGNSLSVAGNRTGSDGRLHPMDGDCLRRHAQVASTIVVIWANIPLDMRRKAAICGIFTTSDG